MLRSKAKSSECQYEPQEYKRVSDGDDIDASSDRPGHLCPMRTEMAIAKMTRGETSTTGRVQDDDWDEWDDDLSDSDDDRVGNVGTSQRGLWLSPHALTRIEKMKKNDRYGDMNQAEKDQSALFALALQRTPTKVIPLSQTSAAPDWEIPKFPRLMFDDRRVGDGESDDGGPVRHGETTTGDEDDAISDTESISLEPAAYKSPFRVGSKRSLSRERSASLNARREIDHLSEPRTPNRQKRVNYIQSPEKFYGKQSNSLRLTPTKRPDTPIKRSISSSPYAKIEKHSQSPFNIKPAITNPAITPLPHVKRRKNILPPIGIPISSSGGLVSCIRSIGSAILDFPKMGCCSVMLNSPKRRIVPLKGDRLARSRAPEVVFRTRLHELGELLPSTRSFALKVESKHSFQIVAHASFTSSLGSRDE